MSGYVTAANGVCTDSFTALGLKKFFGAYRVTFIPRANMVYHDMSRNSLITVDPRNFPKQGKQEKPSPPFAAPTQITIVSIF